jgi:hypothetical protein
MARAAANLRGNGFIIGTAASQNLGFRAQPILFGVSRFTATLFVELVGAPADFFY